MPTRMWPRHLRLRAVMIVATACACASASTANADIVGGGPDETIQQAYGPLMPGQSYAGAFVSSGDADYLAFQVASAGESLSFAVANTTPSCSSPDADFCPVYATLMDQTNQQVGGDGSSAGTVATAGDVEIIAWTFAEPGTYYLLMESNGNLGPGQPSYAVGLAAPADTGPPGPVVKSITVARRQRGNRISARVVLAHAATRLTTTLFALGPHGRQAYIASVTRHPVSARTYALTVGLSAFYRRELARRHQLSLLLKTTITMTSGRRLTYTRRVTLAR